MMHEWKMAEIDSLRFGNCKQNKKTHSKTSQPIDL